MLSLRLFCAPALALLVACGGERRPAGQRPPDVVVILIDTLRADALSTYGNPRQTAPYLAQLAARGTVFAQAWSTSTWTAPATASLLTGVYPDRHGVTRGFLAQFRERGSTSEGELAAMELLAIASDVPTLAERLRERGYQTYGIASNVNIGPEMEFQRGFERFERHDLESAGFLRERLLEWKAEMDARDAPRFLYLHFNDVHKPYDLRPRFYQPEPGRDETTELRARYESELGYLDAFLAKLHSDLGFEDDTLIVVASDHGEEFREHGRLYHDFSLHVELAWVPLIVHAPALRVEPGVAAGNVSLIDVAPTIFDLIGLPLSGSIDGRSLAPLCWATDKDQPPLGGELEQRPLILHRAEDDKHLWGVVQGSWKLIKSEHGYRLYDLSQDPSESQNIADRHPDVVHRLEAFIEAHLARDSRPRSARTEVEIDADLLQRLQAAGYVGNEDDE